MGVSIDRPASSRISSHKLTRYRNSLKSFFGYCREGHLATLFGDAPIWEMLGEMLVDDDLLHDFLNRYPRTQRQCREQEVRFSIALWLAEFAAGIE